MSVVVDLLFYVPPLVEGGLCWSLFWYSLLCVLSSFVVILMRKRELTALLLLSIGFFVTVNVLRLFLAVQWVGLQCVVVAFADHTHLPFGAYYFGRVFLELIILVECEYSL